MVEKVNEPGRRPRAANPPGNPDRAMPPAPAARGEAALHGVAARIRLLRRRSGMTLSRLAEAASLDKGYISRLERSEKTPSITTLMKLADAFSVGLSQLFGDTIDNGAVTVVRRGERQRIGVAGDQGHAYQALFHDHGRHHLSAFLVEPGAEDEREIGQHAGDEMIYVLAGKVEVAFVDRAIVLEPGDCVRFEGHLSHRIRRASKARAQVLIAIARDAAPGTAV